MNLIGISGTNGSGKDALGEILRDDFGWYFVSVSDLLREEVRRRGLPIERHHTRTVSIEWRKRHGLGVLMDKALQDYKSRPKKYSGLVIANLRNPGEADRIHELGGQVVWVDADPKIRYQRVTSRARSAEDQKSFEDFLKEEREEMDYGGSEHSLHMTAVRDQADIFIENNFSSLAGFKKEIERKLGL